ncbi:ATP-binding protein [Alienimonas chondri]|uniref:histidine kinase n=1 Tax=Alienimonas chondri TaxID=2681879 RepID=A0ABX1VIC3_9PLAN|nr:ATP-binding protein [Alienimonas chondri]NNJ27836.1 Sensor histidine kinase RegB [Alienimonas chondri]
MSGGAFFGALDRRWLKTLTGRPRTGDANAGPHADAAAWLVQLRWVAAAGQLVTIAAVSWGLKLDLPTAPLLWVVAVTAGTNVVLAAWLTTHPEHGPPGEPGRGVVPVLGAAMLLDVGLLTALLYFSGGPNNPFYGFYFVNLALAAALLPTRWAWLCDAAAVVGFAFLLTDHVHLPGVPSAQPPLSESGEVSLLTAGRFVAFLTCSGTVVYFATLLRDRVRQRDARVRTMELELARSAKLEALGTLSAGAAHELSTPLGTIAVVANEVSRRIERAAEIRAMPGDRAALDPKTLQERNLRDVRLIRGEVRACRSILDRMSVDAGEAVGEEPAEVTPLELIEETLTGLRDRDAVQVETRGDAGSRTLHVPLVRLAQALRGLVQNALSAADGGAVTVSLGNFGAGGGNLPHGENPGVNGVNDAGGLRIAIRDDGPGMSPAVLARVGEPFFTTKEPGRGTGLGVFLARAVIERLGGSLSFDSAPEEGTTAYISLPARRPA